MNYVKNKNMNFHENNSSYDGSNVQDNSKFVPNRTQKAYRPNKQKGHLHINDMDISKDISQLDIISQNSQNKLIK